MLCLRHHVPIYLSHYPDDWENAGSDENGEKLLMSNRGVFHDVRTMGLVLIEIPAGARDHVLSSLTGVEVRAKPRHRIHCRLHLFIKPHFNREGICTSSRMSLKKLLLPPPPKKCFPIFSFRCSCI